MSYLFSFQRYQIKCVIKFLFRHLMKPWTFKIYLGSSSTAMADRDRKGEDGNTKNWKSWEWKEFFRWNKKKSFIVFEGLLFGEN